MVILGIDPGTADTGYGIIEVDGGAPRVVAHGSIRTSPRLSAADRLLQVHDRLIELIDRYRPDVMAVEKLFFARNERTALAVGRTVGVVLLVAARKRIETVEYTPNEVKLAVVGYGGAEKKQVQYMVARILALEEIPKPDDAADALAIAICHAHSARIRNLAAEGQKSST